MKTSKTILHYCISTHLGGAEQSLLTLVSYIQNHFSNSTQSHLLLPKSDGPLIEELTKRNIPFSVIKMPESLLSISRQNSSLKKRSQDLLALVELPHYLNRVRKKIIEISPDLICTTGIKCHLIAGLLGKTLPIPQVWYFRDILSSPILKKTLHILYSHQKTHVIANSVATGSSLELPHNVIYNGFPIPKANLSHPNFLHQSLNLPSNATLVGVIGVLSPWKGQKKFIEIAYKILKESTKNIHFVIIGDEIYDAHSGSVSFKKELIEFCKKLKVEDRIHFTGFLKNSYEAISNLDILAHTSLKPEPFGRVIVEGMICGTPVVAANDGGAIEIIQNGKTGYLCRPGDIEDYSKTILSLIDNPKKREELSLAAKCFAEAQFSEKSYAESVLKVFDQRLGAK